jgi:hypothetical protein
MDRFEVVAVFTVLHVELVADDGEPHRMRAEEEEAVFDRMGAEVERKVACPTAVPARMVTGFGGVQRYLVCCGM